MCKIKYSKFIFCIFLCFSLVFCTSFKRPEPRVEAVGITLTAATVASILMTILFSAGITAVTVETWKQLKEADDEREWQQYIDSTIQTLNEQDAGLGTSIDTAIRSLQNTAEGQKVTLPESVWDRLKALSVSIAHGNNIIINLTQPIIGTLNDVFMAGHSKVAYNDLPLLYNSTAHSTSTTLNPTVTENFADFYKAAQEFTGSQAPYISCFYVRQDITNSRDGYWGFLYVVGANNTPVVSAETFINSPHSVNIDVRFNDGLNVLCYGLYYSNSRDFWTGMQFASPMTIPADVITLGTYGLAVDSIIKGDITIDGLYYKSVVATDIPLETVPGFVDTLVDDAYDVVTPGRVQDDTGSITGDITITFPVDLAPDVAVGDIIDVSIPVTDVLEDVGVIPVDTVQDVTIADRRPIADVIRPSVPVPGPGVGDYDLHLQNFFPFCIPFDFRDFIGILKASPEAPKFTFNMPTGYTKESGVIYTEYTLDFSQYDTVAYWLRKFELLAFLVGLIMLTRSMFIRS